MSYPGGKNGEGVYQSIINEMPPHNVYIEGFFGSGAVMRYKRPAPCSNVGIDASGRAVELAASNPALRAFGAKFYHANFLEWAVEDDSEDGSIARHFLFRDKDTGGDNGFTLVYLDPPYLVTDLDGGFICHKDRYEEKFSTVEQHTALLQLARSMTANVLISGYRSKLYDLLLHDWRRVDFPAMTRGGIRTESLWCNFPKPTALHDYRFLGNDFRQRLRIKRKLKRWTDRIADLPVLERQALMEGMASTIAATGAMAWRGPNGIAS